MCFDKSVSQIIVWYFVTNVLWQRPASSGAASHPPTLSWNFLQALSSSLPDLLLFGRFPWWCIINLIFRACVDWKSFSHLLHAIFEGFSCWWKSGRGLLLAHLLTLSSSQAAFPVTIYLIFLKRCPTSFHLPCFCSKMNVCQAKSDMEKPLPSVSQVPPCCRAVQPCALSCMIPGVLVTAGLGFYPYGNEEKIIFLISSTSFGFRSSVGPSRGMLAPDLSLTCFGRSMPSTSSPTFLAIRWNFYIFCSLRGEDYISPPHSVAGSFCFFPFCP